MAIDPLTIGSLIVSGASAANKAIQGYRQQRDARAAMAGLQEPAIEVPAALRQRAQEPISEQIMTAQAEEQARRTGQSVGALQKAGARGIIGGLGGIMDAERASERGRMANYEQERRGALGQLAGAEMDVQNRKMQNYLQKMGAAQRGLEAGQQNIAGALDTVSQFGQQLLSAKLSKGDDENDDEDDDTPGSTTPVTRSTKVSTATNAGDLSGMPSTIPQQNPLPTGGPMSLPNETLNIPQTNVPSIDETQMEETEVILPPANTRSLPTRGLKTEPMAAPNMGGIRTGQMPAQGAEDFMDAYEVATQGRSPYEPVQAPSSRGLRRVAMQQPNMGGLRLPQASQYARALEILKRI